MTATTLVANPVLVVIDEDRDLLGTTEQALDDRYGRDYSVEAFRSATVALERLEHLAETQQPVALVLSSQWLTGMAGDVLLKAVHRLHPHAKRALLIAWQERGDVPTGRAVSSAIATGRIDHYVIRPFRPPDESFHHAISSFLLEWSEAMRVAPHTIHVIGAAWSGRAYELREVLGHCALPHTFTLADTAEGQAVLAAAGDSAELPLVSFPDGTVLSNPTNIELAERVTRRRDAQVQRVRRRDRRRRTSRAVFRCLRGIGGAPDAGRRPRRHRRTSCVELDDPQLPRLSPGTERGASRPAGVRAGLDPGGPVRVHATGDRPRA